MNIRRSFLLAAPVLAALASACGGFSSDGGPQCAPAPITVERQGGQLGLGTFEWWCIGSGDPTCGLGWFPSAAAVGSAFDLSFEPSGVPNEVNYRGIEAASPLLVSKTEGYRALQPGTVTFVAMATDAAVDFIDLQLLNVDRIAVTILAPRPEPEDDGDWECPDDRDPIPLADEGVVTRVGESPTLYGTHYAGERRLGGSLSYAWHSLTPEIVTVGSLDGRQAQLTALSEGLARLSVRAGEHEEIVEFEVGAAPIPDEPPRRDPVEPETDSGSDSGTQGGSEDSGTSGDSGSGSDSGSDTGSSSDGGSSEGTG